MPKIMQCPVCGTKLRVSDMTIKHYEPVIPGDIYLKRIICHVGEEPMDEIVLRIRRAYGEKK